MLPLLATLAAMAASEGAKAWMGQRAQGRAESAQAGRNVTQALQQGGYTPQQQVPQETNPLDYTQMDEMIQQKLMQRLMGQLFPQVPGAGGK